MKMIHRCCSIQLIIYKSQTKVILDMATMAQIIALI